MSRKKAENGGSSVPVPSENGCHDVGDARPEWPAKPSWVTSTDLTPDNGYDAASDSQFESIAPTLHEFLTLRGWGGKMRKPGTLRLFAEEGKWKACLNDTEGDRYAFMSGDTILELLEALERALKAGKVDWRKNKKWK